MTEERYCGTATIPSPSGDRDRRVGNEGVKPSLGKEGWRESVGLIFVFVFCRPNLF